MSPVTISLLTIYMLEFPLAFYLNTFVVCTTRRSLRDEATRNPASLIQFFIGVTNISMRSISTIGTVLLCFKAAYYSDISLYLKTLLLIFHHCFSYWLIAWLSAHYCTTITTTHHRLFIWIRKALSTFLPCVLILTAAGSLAVALAGTGKLVEFLMKRNATIMENVAASSVTLKTFSVLILSSCLPCVLILISLLVTVSSLLKHVRNMHRAVSGSAHLNVQVHVNAARTMVLFLLLTITFFMSEIVLVIVPSSFDNPAYVISWMGMMTFQTAEASIIIQASPKLRKMLLERIRACIQVCVWD
ncbi:taste receptor type 2 member 143-like [Gastrophryne carolinensis]